MDTISVVADAAPIAISVEDREAASRYIAAIVARDRHASDDPAFAAWRTRDLWHRFGAEYRTVATGPYARHGHGALRIALGRL